MSDVAHLLRRDRFFLGLINHRNPRAPLVVILCALSFGAVLYLGQLGFSIYDALGGSVDSRTDPRPAVLSVGPVSLSVPRNMIRNHPLARGSVSELEVRMHWPTMEGFSDERAEAFRTNDERATIIYATLRPFGGSLSPQDRMRLVYARILDYPPSTGPGGLIATPFSAGHGYDGETLFTSGKKSEPFAARCAAEGGGVPASCTVEFRSDNGIDVIYRFRRHLLSRWRAIDAAMKAKVASFIQN